MINLSNIAYRKYFKIGTGITFVTCRYLYYLQIIYFCEQYYLKFLFCYIEQPHIEQLGYRTIII